MNADFASFVREASFHLTLSEQMIGVILSVQEDMSRTKQKCGVIYNRATSNALYRRGIVIPSASEDFPKAWKDSASWPYYYELTKAGVLIAELLKEAGFTNPFHYDLPAQEETNYEVKVALKDPKP